MYERPGKLSDKLPAPYMNEVRRAANGSAVPVCSLGLHCTAAGCGRQQRSPPLLLPSCLSIAALTHPALTRLALPLNPAPQEHARYANGGAYPPDLSLITKVRALGAARLPFSLGIHTPVPLCVYCWARLTFRSAPGGAHAAAALTVFGLPHKPANPPAHRPTPCICRHQPLQTRHNGQNCVPPLLCSLVTMWVLLFHTVAGPPRRPELRLLPAAGLP